MLEDGPDLRRQAVLIGCALATAAFAIQFAFGLLWPDAGLGALLAVLYVAVKLIGDRMVSRMAPTAPRMRPGEEWLHWLFFAVPLALAQAILVALGLGAAQSVAAVFPCALFAADIGWLRSDMPLRPDADSLGRRLEAWP